MPRKKHSRNGHFPLPNAPKKAALFQYFQHQTNQKTPLKTRSKTPEKHSKNTPENALKRSNTRLPTLPPLPPVRPRATAASRPRWPARPRPAAASRAAAVRALTGGLPSDYQ